MKILFICYGNACRSPLAEVLARQRLGAGHEIESAGIVPLGFIPEEVDEVLAELGMSGSGLASKPITDLALERVDLVVDLSGAFVPPVGAREKTEVWLTEDPYRRGVDAFRRTRDSIRARLDTFASSRGE